MTVSNVNEYPVIAAGELHVPENSGADTAVGSELVVSDPDAGSAHTIAIVGGDSFGLFKVDGARIRLAKLDGRLNFEGVPNMFALTVKVTDNGSPALSTTSTQTVVITDVNEAPILNDAAVSVEENSPYSALVGAPVTGSDPDFGQILRYQITSGNDGNVFKINQCNGQVMVSIAALDYESQDTYVLGVKVTDDGADIPGPPQLSDTAEVTVTLIDVNEPPVLDDVAWDVEENSPEGTVVGTLSATDVDSGDEAGLTYRIDTAGVFALDTHTGVLTVVKNALDHEAADALELVVEVSDPGSAARGPSLSDRAKVSLTVLDVNEAPIVPPQTRTIKENLAAGTVLTGPLAATDVDAGQSLSFTLEMVSGVASVPFTVHSFTGELSATDSLDFETQSEYTFKLVATDTGSPALRGDNIVTITVIDVNEQPSLTTTSALSVDEDAGPSAPVGSALAVADPDGGQVHTFRLVSASVDGVFSVNAATGQVTPGGGPGRQRPGL